MGRPKLLSQVRKYIRRRNYSYRTGQGTTSKVRWVSCNEMGDTERTPSTWLSGNGTDHSQGNQAFSPVLLLINYIATIYHIYRSISLIYSYHAMIYKLFKLKFRESWPVSPINRY